MKIPSQAIIIIIITIKIITMIIRIMEMTREIITGRKTEKRGGWGGDERGSREEGGGRREEVEGKTVKLVIDTALSAVDKSKG